MWQLISGSEWTISGVFFSFQYMALEKLSILQYMILYSYSYNTLSGLYELNKKTNQQKSQLSLDGKIVGEIREDLDMREH